MKYLLIICSLSLVFISCEKDETIGPNHEQVKNANLNITQSLSASVSSQNFSSGATVEFTAKLEFDKEWVITISGDNSGASTTFSGIGSHISAVWNGSTGGTLPLFQAEPITVTLSFPAHSGTTESIAITSTGVRNIDAGGVLVSDFSAAPIVTFGNAGWESDWPLTTNANGDFSQPDNTPYLYSAEAPWQAGSPYIDITYIPSLYSDPGTALFPLYADPSRVYFNVFVHGDLASQDTWVQFQLVEKSGTTYSYDLRPDWDGWRLISLTYEEMAGVTGGNPAQLEKIGIVLLTDAVLPSSQVVNYAIDHMIFTFDKPLSL